MGVSHSPANNYNKGFRNLFILPTRPRRNLGLLGLLQGLRELGDLGPVKIVWVVINPQTNQLHNPTSENTKTCRK